MESAQGHAVTSIRIFPVSGEPGRSLRTVEVGVEGLAGDRRKKSPVHLVSSAEPDAESVRANLVVDLAPEQLEAALGRVLPAGSVRLRLTAIPSGCPGVYATVETPGVVSVGDPVGDPVGDTVGDPVGGPSLPRSPGGGPDSIGPGRLRG